MRAPLCRKLADVLAALVRRVRDPVVGAIPLLAALDRGHGQHTALDLGIPTARSDL